MIRTKEENNFKSIIKSIPDLLVILDKEGNCLEMFSGNPKYDFWDKKIKNNIGDIFDKKTKKLILENIDKAICTNQNCGFECDLVIKKLRHYYSGNCQQIDYNKVVIIFREITEQIIAKNEVTYLATHDFLTDLPNRKAFQDKLEESIKNAKRTCKRIAVLFIDLDLFKQVNDTYGHNIGDLLLVEIGKRLKLTLRESDFVARIGGDEFGLALTNLDKDDNYKLATKRIMKDISAPYMIRGTEIKIGLSIGISLFPDHSSDAEELLSLADVAMYKIKKSCKNNFKVYKK